jgi:predicted ATPase
MPVINLPASSAVLKYLPVELPFKSVVVAPGMMGVSQVESGKRFIIETHSDYIIDRFRQRQKKANVKSDAHVLFFSRNDGKNVAHSIKIDNSGAYAENQPQEFREFFITEAMENLGI